MRQLLCLKQLEGSKTVFYKWAGCQGRAAQLLLVSVGLGSIFPCFRGTAKPGLSVLWLQWEFPVCSGMSCSVSQ